jgi:hypothetical protein
LSTESPDKEKATGAAQKEANSVTALLFVTSGNRYMAAHVSCIVKVVGTGERPMPDRVSVMQVRDALPWDGARKSENDTAGFEPPIRKCR